MSTVFGRLLTFQRPVLTWRRTGIGLLRIGFGLVWAVNAYFKWQPAFRDNFTSYLDKAGEGQAPIVQGWITFWENVVHVNPHLFAVTVACIETGLAIGLIFGLLSNLTDVVGVIQALLIWSTAEGFGGPYQPGSTDIGTAIIYGLVFVGLFFGRAGLYLALDPYVKPKLGRLSFLAAGQPKGTARAR